MIEQRDGPTFFELDSRVSQQYAPLPVITADCSGAHEFDDAIAVKPLPTHRESYEVTVCSVDTSYLFHNEQVLRQVIQKTESKYYNPSTDKEVYEPMLDKDLTQQLHFIAGAIRKAMMVSFVVGEDLPPQDTKIRFGHVYVEHNYRFNAFGDKCRWSPNFEKYGRAAALITHHLGLNKEAFDEEDAYKDLIHVPQSESWKRGSEITKTYMVGAGNVVGRVMRDEGALAIYRTHDHRDTSLIKVLSPKYAHYDDIPRPHDGLGLDVYTRVGSPLRRAEDFVMLGLLKLRARGKLPNRRDEKRVAEALQSLNARVVTEQHLGITRKHDESYGAPIRHLRSVAS